ncbi:MULTISPECIES: hypothetical protein [unclassified Mycolicibacterium]
MGGVQAMLRAIGFDDRHRALPVEATSTVNDLDAVLPQVGDNVAIGEVIDDDVSLVQHGFDVHILARHDLPHSGNRSGELEDLDGSDQRLGWIACPVVAFPADQSVFDEGDGEPVGCKANSRSHTARAAADHHRVESVGTAHGFSSTIVISLQISVHVKGLEHMR